MKFTHIFASLVLAASLLVGACSTVPKEPVISANTTLPAIADPATPATPATGTPAVTPAVPTTPTAPVVAPTTAPVPSTGNGLLDKIFAKVQQLGTRFIADLQVSATDADAHGDAVASQCYKGLVPIVQGIQKDLAGFSAGGKPGDAGIVWVFQKGRDLKGDVAGGNGKLKDLRVAINLACGALQMDIQAGIADPMGLLSGP